MTARCRSFLSAVVFLMAGSGCNAILGNDAHELAPLSPTGAGGSGAGGAGGSTVVDSGQDRGSPGGDTGVVRPDGALVSDSNPVGLDSAIFQDTGAGDDGGCTFGATECRGRSVYSCSRSRQWVETMCPNACVAGACGGVCVPGTTGCALNVPQTCDMAGQWQNGVPCPSVCSMGACSGSCVPNTVQPCGSATTCNAGGMQTCDATGTWGNCMPMASTCTSVPTGWQPVALTQSTTCPDGFGSPQTFFTGATADPYSCSCNCSGTQACTGTVTLNEYDADADAGASCAGTPSKSLPQNVSASCSTANWNQGNIIGGLRYTLSNVSFAPSACGAAPTATAQPQVVSQTVKVCAVKTTCPMGACLSASEAASMCISQAGTQICPAAFPTRTLMAPTYDDTRGCGTCACGSALTCSLSGVMLNNSSSCGTNNNPYWMTATTMCDAGAIAPTDYPFNAVRAIFTSTGSNVCSTVTTPSAPTGTVALHAGAVMTVCCP